jgi:hypothetical protein
MAISKEQLASIISGRAKHLCNPEGDRLIEGYTRNANGNNPDPSSYDYDADAFDRMYLSTLDEDRESRDINYSMSTAANSRMPEHIKKSMLEQRIDTSGLGQTSVLDTLGVKVPPKKQRKSQVTEQVAQASPVTAGIDYSIIKAIVNECLREHFSKQQLNESTSLQTIGLSNGTISLVDNKGNVFKAKLEKIGNTNEKK